MSANSRKWTWTYFKKLPRRGGECMACGKVYQNGMLSRMEKHLLHCQKLTDQQKAVVRATKARVEAAFLPTSHGFDNSLTGTRPASSTMSSSPGRVSSAAFGTMDRFVQSLPSDTLADSHRDLTRALITSNVPFTFLENPYFVKFLSRLVPAYKLPDRYHGITKSLIPEEYTRIRERIDTAITKAKYIALSTDGWKDNNSRYFLNLLTHVPEPYLHHFEDVTEESETGEKIYAFLKESVEALGPLRISALVTDHAAAMRKAWRLLKKDYPWIQTIGCKGHAFNLLTKDIVEHAFFAELISQCDNLVTFFGCKTHKAILLEAFKQAEILPLVLIKRCTTRWNSAFNCIERIVQLRAIIESALYSPKFKTATAVALRQEICIPTFWEKVTCFAKLLEPIAKATVQIQSDSTTVSESFHIVTKTLQEVQMTVSESSIIPEASRLFIAEKVVERGEFMQTDVPFLASLLDPYSRGNTLSDAEKNKGRHLLRSSICLNPSFGSTIMVDLQQWEAKVGDWEPHYAGPSSEAWQALNDNTLNAKSWWDVYFPDTQLGRLVKFIASIPITSAASERTWSIRGAIQTKPRNRLLTSTTDKLAFIKYNINLLDARAKKRTKQRFPIQALRSVPAVEAPQPSAQSSVLDSDDSLSGSDYEDNPGDIDFELESDSDEVEVLD